MGISEVFEVLYSPLKAFKKIVAKPDFKGVLLILVLFMSFTVVTQYVVASKLLLRTVTPYEDDWTESLADQHNWTSNGSPSLDETDYKMGNAVGNHSVRSLVFNDTSVWIKLTDIGSLDCSADTGYVELFFWIKWIHKNGSFPSSGAILRLFSGNESSYFELNLTSFLASNDEWRNATLKIGQNLGWDSINSPDWKSVTGLEFRLVWPAPSNLTMKIDDLRFQRYVSFLDTGTFSTSIIGILITGAVVPFSMNWILWGAVLLMITKVFHEDVGPWTVFFVIIGHIFIVTVVYTIFSAPLISLLPQLSLPTKTWPPTTEAEAIAVNILIEKTWYPSLAYQVVLYLPLVAQIWTAGLGAVAIRTLRGITWGRAVIIAGVAFIIRLILIVFLGF